MALKKCKECGAEVSSTGVCPKCGKDQRNFFVKHKVITFLLVVAVLAIIIGFIVIMISQIIGKTVIYSNAVSVITMVYSLIAYVIITINKKKMENEFNKIMK